jgi:hypothetical protein
LLSVFYDESKHFDEFEINLLKEQNFDNWTLKIKENSIDAFMNLKAELIGKVGGGHG